MKFSKIEIIDGEQYVKIDLLEEELKQNKLLQQENQQLKEIIEKTIEYIETHKRKNEFLELNEWGTREFLEILKGNEENK